MNAVSPLAEIDMYGIAYIASEMPTYSFASVSAMNPSMLLPIAGSSGRENAFRTFFAVICVTPRSGVTLSTIPTQPCTHIKSPSMPDISPATVMLLLSSYILSITIS